MIRDIEIFPDKKSWCCKHIGNHSRNHHRIILEIILEIIPSSNSSTLSLLRLLDIPLVYLIGIRRLLNVE